MRVICPYCNNPAKLVDSKTIYGKSYGKAYLCRPCDAYVGCHKGTNRPLGTPANRGLREARKKAHKHFDKLWKPKQGGYLSRGEAYEYLAREMGLSMQGCHIGLFNLEQCKRVVQLSKPKPFNGVDI